MSNYNQAMVIQYYTFDRGNNEKSIGGIDNFMNADYLKQPCDI